MDHRCVLSSNLPVVHAQVYTGNMLEQTVARHQQFKFWTLAK